MWVRQESQEAKRGEVERDRDTDSVRERDTAPKETEVIPLTQPFVGICDIKQ